MNLVQLMLVTATGEARHCLSQEQLSHDSVHAARKALNKARAALRLLRSTFSDDDYRRYDIALRDAGRSLSPLRDAYIMLNTLESFFDVGKDAVLRDAEATRLRSAIETHLANMRTKILHPHALAHCIELIDASRARGTRQEIEEASTEVMQAGLRRVYRSARKAFMAAREERTDQSLHTWRKKAKYLRTAAAVLRTGQSRRLHETEKAADDIANWLGKDHDLVALREFVIDSGLLGAGAPHPLFKRIEQRRQKFQRKALAAGEKLFRHKPNRFVADAT